MGERECRSKFFDFYRVAQKLREQPPDRLVYQLAIGKTTGKSLEEVARSESEPHVLLTVRNDSLFKEDAMRIINDILSYADNTIPINLFRKTEREIDHLADVLVDRAFEAYLSCACREGGYAVEYDKD